ncbi:MAG: hypothetical protein JWM21_3855 [Acidobacteria bacterium]|nr:hypothetical protein [Acidobacteriota bacterium]
MKKLFTSALIFCLSIGLLTQRATAQDDARAAWQITGFDIAANVLQSERALAAVATLTIKNVGRASGTGLTLRLNSKAKIKSVSANGAPATFHLLADVRPGLQRLNITLLSPLAPNATTNLSVDYRISIDRNSGLEAISPLGSQFLPLTSVSAADPTAGGWYPVLNTPFTVRATDSAPFKLRVEGTNVISSGNETSAGSSVSYDQAFNGQPFFLQGVWERVEGSGDAKGITAFLPPGAAADERKQAEAMSGLAAAARAFYALLLGPAPATPIRLVAVRRGSGFNDGGTLLIERGAFRREKLDAATAMLIAESVARLWIGGQTAVRGEGSGVIRDGLTRYLATLFLEKQFGRDAMEAELLRERAAYATVAKRDAPLSRSTPLDDSYFSGVPNKSAMIWRLLDRRLGREAFLSALRPLLQSGTTDQGGISLAALRVAIGSRGDEALKKLLDHELDQATEMDLMIGLPQQRGAEWVAALRNLGSLDAQVTVVATTDRGEQLKLETTVPAQNFADAVFKTAAKIVRVEVDPDRLYPQIDYANDVAPRVRDVNEAMAEASRFFGAQDFVRAESTARDILAAAPRMQEARILLARALLGQSKLEEAEKLFRAALDDALPTAVSLAWANIGLGEIALKKGQTPEAARRFNDAVRAEGEYASALVSRAGRIRAESVGNAAPPVDETARAFVTQLEKDITSGSKVELENKIIPGELVRFVNGILGTRPDSWQTKVLRTEQLDAAQTAVDVSINSKVLGKESAGTAVFILARVGGAWKLAGIELFEVR